MGSQALHVISEYFFISYHNPSCPTQLLFSTPTFSFSIFNRTTSGRLKILQSMLLLTTQEKGNACFSSPTPISISLSLSLCRKKKKKKERSAPKKSCYRPELEDLTREKNYARCIAIWITDMIQFQTIPSTRCNRLTTWLETIILFKWNLSILVNIAKTWMFWSETLGFSWL